MKPGVIHLDQMTITGVSTGGHETWFRVQPPDIALDVGHGPPQLTGVECVFLSHGHLDHAAGLPALLSQRAMHGLGQLRIFCPREIVERLGAYIRAAAELEGKRYDYTVHGLGSDDRVNLGHDYEVRTFRTDHGLPSLGYHLVQSVDRLRARFRDRSVAEIADLRRRRVEISRTEERLLLSYLGDTGPRVFDDQPAVFEAKVLLVECTFLAPEHRRRAARFGHLHLDDIAAVESRFCNDLIILHHLSHRFSPDELRQDLVARLPRLSSRVRILGEARS